MISRECDKMIEIYDIKGNIIKKFGDSWAQKKFIPSMINIWIKAILLALKIQNFFHIILILEKSLEHKIK